MRKCIKKQMKEGKLTLIFSEGERQFDLKKTNLASDCMHKERPKNESMLVLFLSGARESTLSRFILKVVEVMKLKKEGFMRP